MTYFQEKLQQLLVSLARKNIIFFNSIFIFFSSEERDAYRTLYQKERDRRVAVEIRLKENNNSI
jgi:hypothetical protein